MQWVAVNRWTRFANVQMKWKRDKYCGCGLECRFMDSKIIVLTVLYKTDSLGKMCEHGAASALLKCNIFTISNVMICTQQSLRLQLF